TDVDDKINAKAAEEGVPISAITDRYLAAYNADAAALGALMPTVQPRATETMDAIVAMIGRLVDNNSAYAAEGHVLFDTQAFTGYGKLSGRPLDEMIAGARVEIAPYKRHPADFVLWKPSKPGEPVWESPWGPGRPGWHIECSAMIEQELGLPIDIHGGGIDLVFPHHENELAQGVCDGHHHKGYANYWLHNGFLNMGDEKMSKSLGNVALAHDLLEQQPGEVIRWALLGAHYRQPLAWTEDALGQARNSLDHLYGVLGRARHVEAGGSASLADDQLAPLLDDLNTPAAMAELKRLATDLDAAVRKAAPNASAIKQDLMALAEVMGFLQAEPQVWFQGGADEGLKAQIDELIAARDAARVAKDWSEADRIRAELTALNVEVMDGPAGATWRIKEQA
ncbi:cysteine--tRNA ligase, partial [Phenylobacterium sp.]|uniref:cysteine--tRNA ligase n=1 Tax=Phenylobacterium sp. TaxID=1871053 RepID=UPI003567118D